MIRPFTVVCMLMAVGSGLYLYQCKHQAQMLDRQIARTIKQTDEARDRIGMLRAEWAQLNAPEHIAELAHAHTTLQTAKPTQFISTNDLASKLPAPVAPAHQMQPTDLPEEPAAAPPVAQAEPPQQVATAAPKADAKPETKPDSRVLAAADPKPAQHATRPEPVRTERVRALSSPQVASSRAFGRRPSREIASLPVNADATAPGTVGAAVLRAMRAREGAATRAYVEPVATREPAYAPRAYVAPVSASMLGGARGALPPPVPFAAR